MLGDLARAFVRFGWCLGGFHLWLRVDSCDHANCNCKSNNSSPQIYRRQVWDYNWVCVVCRKQDMRLDRVNRAKEEGRMAHLKNVLLIKEAHLDRRMLVAETKKEEVAV